MTTKKGALIALDMMQVIAERSMLGKDSREFMEQKHIVYHYIREEKEGEK